MTIFFINVSKVEVSETSRKRSCKYILANKISFYTKVCTLPQISLANSKKSK